MGYLSSGDSARVEDREVSTSKGWPLAQAAPTASSLLPRPASPLGTGRGDWENDFCRALPPHLYLCLRFSVSLLWRFPLTAEESRACLKATQLESGSGTWIVGTWGRGKK